MTLPPTGVGPLPPGSNADTPFVACPEAALSFGGASFPVSSLHWDLPLTGPAGGFAMPSPSGFGFLVALDEENAAAWLALFEGAELDPGLDERLAAWRCPGCGLPSTELPTGHWWRTAAEESRCGTSMTNQPKTTP